MRLSRAIENYNHRSDGGPLCCTLADQRRIGVARDQYLDWTLTDPDRFSSDKHCEARKENGPYFLHDGSNSSAFLNRSERRLQSPDRLQMVDRSSIGNCIVAVSISDDSAAQQTPRGIKHRPTSYERLWDAKEEAPPANSQNDLPPSAAKELLGAYRMERRIEIPALILGSPNRARDFPASPHLTAELHEDADWAPRWAKCRAAAPNSMHFSGCRPAAKLKLRAVQEDRR